MTTAACPKCNANLPANSPEGLCPKCLLQAGLRSDADAAKSVPSPRSQQGFIPPTPAELAEHFPQLEIFELIGRGGMGAVYKARHRELDRPVALKILPPEVGGDPAFAERFSREARALAKLNHPNIVGVYDSGRAGGLYYFLMEYIDGVNLREAMQAGRLSAEEALAIVPQICDALQYAHDEGIVHRDIKPENVLVDNKGRVKIADFGLAKLLGRQPTDLTLTQTHQVMGTPRYMAPEQMTASHDVDHRADIYSLGVVFYELLTGEVPMGRFDPPSKRVQVDVRLDEIVLRTLQREPSRRYQRASELKTDVEVVTRSTQVTRTETSAIAGTVNKSRTWLIIASLAGALMMFGLSVFFIIKGDVEKLEHFPAPNNVVALLACGSAIACGLCLLAAAIAGRDGVQHRWLSPRKLAWGFVFTTLCLMYFAFNTAFKDPPVTTRSIDGEIVDAMPNNVDAFAALGFLIAAGISVIGVIVVALGGRARANGGPFSVLPSMGSVGEHRPEMDARIPVDTDAGGRPSHPRKGNKAAALDPLCDEINVEQARRSLKIPAIGLIVVGILTVVSAPLLPLIPAAIAAILPVKLAGPRGNDAPADEQVGEPVGMPTNEALSPPWPNELHTETALEPISPIRDQSQRETANSSAPASVSLASEPATGEIESEVRGPEGSEISTAAKSTNANFVALIGGLILFILVGSLPGLTIGALIIAGGRRMMSLQRYGFAVAAAILALLPCQPLFILGLVFGIWSLIVLARPHVKAAFVPAA